MSEKSGILEELRRLAGSLASSGKAADCCGVSPGATLRQSILELQQHAHPQAQRAGTLWGAALGAIILATRHPEEGAAKRLIQANALLTHGTEAWLAFLGDTMRREAEVSDGNQDAGKLGPTLFTELAAACEAGRRATKGHPGASRQAERHVGAAKRNLRALRAEAR